MAKIVFPKISLNNIKGILIDIDNTLYPYQLAHLKALDACYNVFSKEFPKFYSLETFSRQYTQKRKEVTKRLQPQGTCRSRLFAFQDLFENIGISQAFNKALKYEILYWNIFIESMKLSKNALYFLYKCKNKKIPVCAVSDMQSSFQIRKLQKLGIDHLIDYLVTSEEVGVEKPSSKIFYKALTKLNLKVKDVIMIGDSEEKDIKGAKKIGMKAFQVLIK